MSHRSSLPVRLMSMVGLVAVGLLATWDAPKAFADGDRLGCGTFCQNAGGYGAPADPRKPSVTIASGGTITSDADGYAPVTLTCNLAVQCSGALLLCLQTHDPALINLGMAGECGRSDLVANAGATRTIGVPFPAPALTYLRSHGPTTSTLNAAIAQPPDGFTNLNSANLTVAAPG
jgi:hypothetical protein